MGKKVEKIETLLELVEALIFKVKGMEKVYAEALESVHPNYRSSAKNLAYYRGLRLGDIRALQKQLGYLGMSRIAKAESHVMASLLATQSILKGFISEGTISFGQGNLPIKKGGKLLKTHTKSLLGYRSKGRRTRIMVTMPNTAAEDGKWVEEMIKAGMNCARINCAHDNEEVWKKIIDHIRAANKKLSKNCKVAMDLAGPKIRTGAMQPGPEILKLSPDRSITGHITQPVRVWLGEQPHPEAEEEHLPLAQAVIESLKLGEEMYLTDTRGKQRTLKIVGEESTGKWAHCYDTLYLQSGSPIFRDKDQTYQLGKVGTLPALVQKIILNAGDALRIDKAPILGEPAAYNEEGVLLAEAHISCTAPAVFEYIQQGEPVLFDDGKIEGSIEEITDEYFRVRVSRAKVGGGKLRSDKGINFPQTKLQIRGLTAKDKRDFVFVAAHADVVNMSFVNSPTDVEELIQIMERLEVRDTLGVILKIETQQGFNNLTDILLKAMQVFPVGVMIARGDLAIETGWEQVGRIQEEMLSLCQAAHIPVVWATQVLESLAKKGVPSRAEITDAVMAQRAECVMLNKGPQILEAITLLDTILKAMAAYQEKKAPMSPALEGVVGK
ncbi:MAG: pyruvate kinase [Bacteroidota bacterium]